MFYRTIARRLDLKQQFQFPDGRRHIHHCKLNSERSVGGVYSTKKSQMNTFLIVTLCVSFLSMTISVISILNQERYNRNNVKPFCSVYEANYDNFIFVGIKNDGLGPLILKEIMFSRDDRESLTSLFDLLPDSIKHTTYHRIYVGELKQRALSVGEKLPLLSISIDDDSIRQKIRNLLKTITIRLKYVDLYKKPGKNEKN